APRQTSGGPGVRLGARRHPGSPQSRISPLWPLPEPADGSKSFARERCALSSPAIEGRAMTTPTGIQAIDRVLEQHGPFPDAETAEALAARLLAIWHALQPCSGGLDAT